MTLEETKQVALGSWTSIATEVRPSASKNLDGSLKPFYLCRKFTYLADDQFKLEITNFAEPLGKIPLAKLLIKGHVVWHEQHPITAGAYKVDFTADVAYEVTPLAQPFTDILNRIAVEGYSNWETGVAQSILAKTFVPFGLSAGQFFKEYDLIYILNDLMFWGARNIDGRGFDTEENRPTNLQIPMIRSKYQQ